MRFGDYDCFPIEFGDFLVDGGAMFGVIPKIQWNEKITADDLNRIKLKTRSLLIQGNGRNILVDTGYGYKLSPDMKSDYGIDQNPMDMNLLLSGFELDIYQITDVILSHLHFDHTGGSTVLKNGRLEPTFPNARYHVQTEQWEQACNPHERDKDSFLSQDFLPLQEYDQLQLLDGSLEIHEGIEVMVSYGHTMAQQHVVVKDPAQSLFFCADLVPTTAHIPVSWHMSYDNKPLDLFPEKDYFLRKAVRENWLLFFEHDPAIAAATLKEVDGWVEMDQVIDFV